jgi:hypothetical protein
LQKTRPKCWKYLFLPGKNSLFLGEKRKGYLCGKSLDGESGVVAQNLWFWKKKIPM